LVQVRVLNLPEGEAEAGCHQMEYDRALDVLLQCALAAHRAIGGDRRQNCSWALEVPASVVWAIQVEMSRAESDARRENASQLVQGLQQPSH